MSNSLVNLPLVSIIIVSYNGKKLLDECFKSLSNIIYPNYEIILVDNNSSDDSIEFVKKKYPQTKILQLDANYGFAKPSNLGVSIARGDYILFLNNDTIVENDFLIKLVNVIMSDSKVAMCQSLLKKPNGKIDSAGDFIDMYGRPYSSKYVPESPSLIFSAKGACMLLKKQIFYDVGKFDEKFFVSFEDVDLSWRMWIRGYEIVLVPDSIVYHLGSYTVKRNKAEVQLHGTKNQIVLILTCFEIPLMIKSIIMITTFIIMRKLFRTSIIKDTNLNYSLPSSTIMSKAIFWILKNIPYVVRKRLMISSTRIVSSKDLIKKEIIRH